MHNYMHACKVFNLLAGEEYSMRTTLILKDDLLKRAIAITGIKEKTAVIHKGLEALIQNAAIERLIKLGGSAPQAKAARRRRPR